MYVCMYVCMYVDQLEPEISQEIEELLIVYMIHASGGVIEKSYTSKFMIRNNAVQNVLCQLLHCSRKELKRSYKTVIDGSHTYIYIYMLIHTYIHTYINRIIHTHICSYVCIIYVDIRSYIHMYSHI